MKKETIQAAILYKLALEENHAELVVPLEDCRVCYVPNMPHSHRSIWIEEVLYIFYCSSSEEFGNDYLKVSDSRHGTRRSVHLDIVDNNDIDYHMITIASSNLQQTYSRSLRPHYVEVDPVEILKVMKLLAFT